MGLWREPDKAGRLGELGLVGSVSVHTYAGRATASPDALPPPRRAGLLAFLSYHRGGQKPLLPPLIPQQCSFCAITCVILAGLQGLQDREVRTEVRKGNRACMLGSFTTHPQTCSLPLQDPPR